MVRAPPAAGEGVTQSERERKISLVYISIRIRSEELVLRRVARFARGVLKSLGKTGMDLSMVLTGDREIRRYNRKYLKHDRATDVLAFGYAAPASAHFLGDIMISVDQAKAYARRFGIAWRDELELYIVHGILHLLGYDDHAPADKKKMRAEESRVLKQVRSNRIRV